MHLLKPISHQAFATVPDAFLPHELDIICDIFTKAQKQIAVVGNGITNPEIRESNIHWVFPQDHPWLFTKLSSVITEVNNQHFHYDLDGFPSIQLTEYDAEKEGHYGAHIDAMWGWGGEMRHRKLSLTLQLSHPDEYEGGELRLYPDNLTPVIAEKRRGIMTLFRSHIIHEVTPVTKGKRLSLVVWVHGPLVK